MFTNGAETSEEFLSVSFLDFTTGLDADFSLIDNSLPLMMFVKTKFCSYSLWPVEINF